MTQSGIKHPNIVILATGGTIAGTGTSLVARTYQSGQITIDNLLEKIPQLSELANITGRQLAQIGSQAMNNQIWLELANNCNELLASSDVDGIVITHGTDTMEETAYFLNLVIKSRKPVVLVGAMRSSTSISADGPINIYNGVALAANPESAGRGVLITMGDAIYDASDATKTSTNSVSAFQAPNLGPLGYIDYGHTHFYEKSIRRHTIDTEFSIQGILELPRVDIIYGHANCHRTFVDAAVAAGAKGIVHAGVGNGNIYPETLEGLVEARNKGVLVVRSSHVGSGRVTRYAEIDDDQYGFIVSDILNPKKSRILLMLALLKTTEVAAIQRMFYEY